jgi:hypothetical protein
MGQRYSNKPYKIILLRLKIGIFNAKLVLSTPTVTADAAFIWLDRGVLHIFSGSPRKETILEPAKAESEGWGVTFLKDCPKYIDGAIWKSGGIPNKLAKKY